MFPIRVVLAAGIIAVAGLCAAAPVSIGNILPTMENTTVTLAGTAAGWKDSWKTTAPNTFYLTDATGSIRVCIWPDDLAEVPPPVAENLKKKGTPIRLSGEVAVFRERVELHVKDGASVGVITAGAPVAAPGQPAAAPVAPAAPAAPSVPVGYAAPQAPSAPSAPPPGYAPAAPAAR